MCTFLLKRKIILTKLQQFLTLKFYSFRPKHCGKFIKSTLSTVFKVPIWTCAKMFQTYWSSALHWCRGKLLFNQIMAFSNLKFCKVLISTGWQVCNISFFHSFLAIDLKLCIAITDILKMCTYYFEEKWERDCRRGQYGGMDKRSKGASSVSYRHNFLVYIFHKTRKVTPP